MESDREPERTTDRIPTAPKIVWLQRSTNGRRKDVIRLAPARTYGESFYLLPMAMLTQALDRKSGEWDRPVRTFRLRWHQAKLALNTLPGSGNDELAPVKVNVLPAHSATCPGLKAKIGGSTPSLPTPDKRAVCLVIVCFWDGGVARRFFQRAQITAGWLGRGHHRPGANAADEQLDGVDDLLSAWD